MNKALRLAVRNAVCTACRLSAQAEDDDVCVTGQGPNNAKIVIITKTPLADRSKMRAEIEGYCKEVGIDTKEVMWLSALKCRVWDLSPTKTDQKACATYLREELKFINPDYVLCLGSEAWFAASGWADITKNRGKLFDVPGGDGVIYPTISPAAVARNPGMRGGFIADLQNFARLTRGEDDSIPFHTNAGAVTVVRDATAFRSMLRAVQGAWVASYDIESGSSLGGHCAEYDPGAVIVSISITVASGPSMKDAHCYNVPLFHPESWLRKKWLQATKHITKALIKCPRRVAHNAKFDTKWLKHFSNLALSPTFDTIVAAALLDENRPKGLKPLASVLLGADAWGIDTKDLLDTPLEEVLEYNGLDTWHTLRLYLVFRQQLLDQPRLGRLFKHLMIPLVSELVDVERRGVYVHQDVLMQNWHEVRATLERIHEELEQYLPKTNPYIKIARDGTVKHDGINYNASNFLRWWLFEHLGLPVLARGKTKDDGTPGDPSTAEAIMMVLAEQHPAAKLLLERVKWNKFDTSFFRPWSEQIDENSRMHSVFKPWGTVTGRLSSGKEDAEKITARGQVRGVNLQQVPRGALTRSVFGAPPGSFFIEADYSQIELRIAAFIAREDTMLHLYATGQDIHTAMAMRMTGKPKHAVTKEERKAAKAVNFGFLYGMGWKKFIQTAWETYGIRVTEDEARAFRKAFFDEFPKLPGWHNRQRRLVHQFGRVETPMGRVRHLPDIYSPEEGVVAEAERHAINSPVQGFASDMCALSLVHIARKFRKLGLERSYPIGTVHDAVNLESHADDILTTLPIIKHTMENLPLERLFGVVVDVPIVADLKIGIRWGSALEIPAELLGSDQVSNNQLNQWLNDNVRGKVNV
jgi:uracil-DNA glycosylase family 4